jgi:hypothetical protein
MFTPAVYRDRNNFRLVTMVGVRSARRSGNVISGHFKAKLAELTGAIEANLVETFVNWPNDSDNILGFTRQYGPLKLPATENGDFSFPIEDWKQSQAYFHELWKQPKTLEKLGVPDGTLRFSRGTITYEATDLFRYLQFDLLMNESERVRVCRRIGCSHPYFVAAHLKKRFCSPECAEEGQKEAKREWWQRNGKEWRQTQKDKD